MLRVVHNPETQSLPADLHPPRDHAYMVTVELPSRHPNDKQADLYTKQKTEIPQG